MPSGKVGRGVVGLGRKALPQPPSWFEILQEDRTVSAGTLSASVMTGPRPEVKDGSAGEVAGAVTEVLTHPGAWL